MQAPFYNVKYEILSRKIVFIAKRNGRQGADVMADSLFADEYIKCKLCPRKCNINRYKSHGFCGETAIIRAARASVHMWEEPVISGENGSGTIFFSGCNMKCVFCQNHTISIGENGREITTKRLVEIFYELEEKGVNNINLVTADHFIPSVSKSIEMAKNKGFELPFLFNTSSYISVDALRQLDGLIDIYLPDFKYFKSETGKLYSNAPDYPDVARAAIKEMVRQMKRFDKPYYIDEKNVMKHGVIVRHLLMPGGLLEAKLIVRELYETYKDDIFISLMNQYTPILDNVDDYPKLMKKVTEVEYRKLIDYAVDLGVVNGFMQEGETCLESFIPEMDERGI